jgi:hypothetical protein
LLSSFVGSLPLCYLILFAIFDPQCSLIFLKYLPLYMCMCFHLFLLDMHTVLEELSLYWPSKFFRPFLAMNANGGEVLRVLKGIGYYALVFFLKHWPFMLCIIVCCFAWLSI